MKVGIGERWIEERNAKRRKSNQNLLGQGARSPALDTSRWSQRPTVVTVNLELGILKAECCIIHHSLLFQMLPEHLNLWHSRHIRVKVHLIYMTFKAMQDLSGLVTTPQKIRQEFCTKRCLAGVVRQNYFSIRVKASILLVIQCYY